MSSETREKIAAAANAVPGLNVSGWFRQSTKAGDGMVRLERSTRAENRFGFMDTWQVLVVLPQGIAESERWLDDHRPALVEAIGEELVVTTVTPSSILVDNGSAIPVVVVEGSRSAG